MAGDETRDDQWGDKVAKVTFLITVGCAVLFVAAVAIFILSAGGGR